MPFIGDVVGIKLGKPVQSVLEQSRDLGPISARKVLRTQIVTVSGADLVGELSDESRFRKFVGLHLPPLRHIVGDARACIGRQFALHEAVLALGLILHRYRLTPPDAYKLQIAESLTLKPRGFALVPCRRR